MIIHKGIALPDGKQLTWSTKVKDVLGDLWQLSDEYATEHADLDDLAGMRLGMATHAFAKMSLDPPEDPADQLRRLRLLPWGGGQFRRQFGYDSNNYVALSHLAPVLTGKPYHSFLDDEIFRPLKMASATGDSNIVRASGNAADGFLRKGGDPSESGTGRLGSPQSVGWWTQDDGFWCLAAGGVSMNIRDAVSQDFCEASCRSDAPRRWCYSPVSSPSCWSQRYSPQRSSLNVGRVSPQYQDNRSLRSTQTFPPCTVEVNSSRLTEGKV